MHLQTRWPDLLPDLLRQISGRLHHTIDFVRFHAVCRSWRDSYHPMAMGTSQFFLPWLLAPNMKNCDALRLTCVFSKMSYHSPHIPTSPCWVANADGTAARYFGRYPYSSLHDPLTGRVATLVPHVPVDKDKWFGRYTYPRGVVYDDGTILLYIIRTIRNDDLDGGGNTTKFRAALMRPGDVAWTVVERILEALRYGETCVAYHGGKIFVSVDASQWHVVMLNDDVVGDMLVPTPSMLPNQGDYYYQCGHVLKSRGELLWVSLHILTSQDDGCGKDACDLVQALSLSVYGIQEEVSVSNKIRWMKKDGKSLADRIMFLGSSYSFAIDASQLGVDGGYAYFVHSDGKVEPYEWSAVLRYNLVDKKLSLSSGFLKDGAMICVHGLSPSPPLLQSSRLLCNTSKIQYNYIHKYKSNRYHRDGSL